MRAVLAIFALVGLSSTCLAASIKCEQAIIDYETGEDKVISTLMIELGTQGEPTSLRLDRVADEEFGELHISLDAKSAKFSRGIEAGNLEGIDEDTGEPYFAWSIDQIEKVRAIGKDISVRLDINDHLYSGTPGSTIFIIQKGQEVALPSSGDAMTNCEGPFLK